MKSTVFSILVLFTLLACKNNDNQSDAYGNFEATELFISSEVAGKLMSFTVEEGDVLEANQQVALVDTVPLVLKMEQLQASKLAAHSKLAQVNASIGVLQAQKAIVQKDFDRINQMKQDGAATQKQFDDLQGQLSVMGRQLGSYQTNINSINQEVNVVSSQMDEVTDKLSRCRIIIPSNGTVLQKLAEAGELVAAGKPLLKMANLNEVYLRAYVSGSQLPSIQLGQEVTLRIDKNEKELTELKGKISWISASAEFTPKIIQTREERVDLVYAIKVAVVNDGSIKIGMPGEIKF